MADKTPRLSFRKEPRTTGLAGIGEPYPDTKIKMDGMIVGTIGAPNWNTKDNCWSLWFMIYGDTGNPNCNWSNRRMKPRFATEPEARQWVKDNWPKLVTLGLRGMKDED